jgi:hypothetical protein
MLVNEAVCNLRCEIESESDPPHFDFTQAVDKEHNQLVYYLIRICTIQNRQYSSSKTTNSTQSQCHHSLRRSDSALCERLLSIATLHKGVNKALALHALQLWCSSPSKIDFLLSRHIIAILLDALRVSLVADCSDIPATYTSSVAVLLLRNIIREPATHSLALNTFLDHQGVGLLLRALKFAKTDRALSLALYLLKDISRHSPTRIIHTVLETAESNTSASASHDGNGLSAVVDILNKRDNISEPTKFAALLVNRWALDDASTRAAFIQVGVIPALLNVLKIWFETNYSSSGTKNNSDGINDIAIYALSALSIVSQENPSMVTSALLSSSAREGGKREEAVVILLLRALTAAMQCYEHRFSPPPSLSTVRLIGGGSYPHALLSGMFDMTTTSSSSSTNTNRQGAIQLIEQLIHCGLLPDWLAMRYVGGRILETTLQPEVRSAVFNNSRGIDSIGLQQKGEEEGEKASLLSSSSSSQGQVAIALSHLAQRSPTFLADLCTSNRLTILARGALQEAVQVALNVMEEEEEEEEEDGDEREEVSPLSLHDKNNHTCVSTALDNNGNSNIEWKVPLAPTAAATITTTPTVLSQDLPGLLSTLNSTGNIGSSSGGKRECSVSLSGQKRKAMMMMRRSPSFTSQNDTYTAVIAATAGNNKNKNESSDAMRNELCQYTAAVSRIWSYLQHSTDAIKEYGKEEEHINASSSCCCCIHPNKKGRRKLSFNREDVGKKRYDTLTLTVGGGEGGCEIHAVGFLLEAWSPVFRQLLRNTVNSLTEKITIPCIAGFSEETMHALVLLALEYCYTGTIQTLPTTDAIKLWTVAEYLQTDCLQRYCESVLITGFEGSPVLVRQCYELAAPSPPPSGMYLRAAVGEYLIKKICVSGGIYNNNNGGEVVALVLSHVDSLVEDVSGVLKREIQGGWVCPHIKERSKE